MQKVDSQTALTRRETGVECTQNRGDMLANTRTPEREMETMSRGEGDWRHWVQERIRRLPFRLRRDAAPELALGTRVLVVKGEVQNDLGQRRL
jgi:hypothetical protein